MKKILLFIILNILLFNFSYADDADSKQKELETKIKLLEKELEIEKLKKELAEQKKANEKTKNTDKPMKISIVFLIRHSIYGMAIYEGFRWFGL